MTPMQELLFGEFPRDAGIPTRFPLFSKNHFDSFVEKAGGKYNLYCSISRYDHPHYYCDKILYDFDASWDGLFDIEANPPEKFEILREDSRLAQQFLGKVVSESKRLVKKSLDDSIPVVGCFTGKGIHVYQLFREKRNPRDEMYSTANKYKEELGLETLDVKPIGDVMRISRIPRSQRVWERGDSSVPCPLYTTPLSEDDLLSMDPEWLLEVSQFRTRIDVEPPHSRPIMEVHEDYLRRTELDIPQQDFDSEASGIDDEYLEWYVKRVVQMPCVSKRALTRSPSHEVRMNFAIHLFNSGLGPDEVLGIIKKLNWRNFDRGTTRKQLNQIYRNGYSEMSCRTMQDYGLCVHSENPGKCPAYGWKNRDGCRWRE